MLPTGAVGHNIHTAEKGKGEDAVNFRQLYSYGLCRQGQLMDECFA